MIRVRRLRRYTAVALVVGAGAPLASAPPATAFNPLKLGCTVAGAVSPTAKKACMGIKVGLTAFSVMKGLFGGGGSTSSSSSSGSSAATTRAATAAGLVAIGTWVLGGATFAVHEAAKVLGDTTAPQLQSTWFSSRYWRVAAIAAVLTLPFLCAAAVQALIRSDMALLLRSVLGYLPLAMLAVAIAAPLTMLLLAASDQLANAVSSASGNASTHFLRLAGKTLVALTVLARAPFLVFFIGLLTAAGALALWVELLVRDAAVYVIVLMMPLVFAAMVWPARRVWAARAVETLVALILSKFAIVAVLSLGGAALSNSQGLGLTGMIAGVVLLGMGVFAPWALLRLIPLAELASSAAGSLRREAQAPAQEFLRAWGRADRAEDWATKTAAMRRESERGLGVGADPPTATNGTRRSEPAPGHRDADPASGDAVGDPATDDHPIPEPEDPDLAAGDRADGHREPPETVIATDPGQGGSRAKQDLPDLLRHEDLTQEVTLGPEGIGVAPRWRHARPQSERTPPGATRGPADPSRPAGDDQDPTPPPQTPPEGRL